MLKWFMKRKLKAFGDAFDYDTSYMQELVDVDPAAGIAVSRLSAVASYRADAPAAAWFAGKLVAGMSEDCGPCVQLGVRMAERSGVSASDLRAIISGDVARMSAEASLGYRFAKALLARAKNSTICARRSSRAGAARRWARSPSASSPPALSRR